jgi:YegS/Rv2252/BmrU family lipid kinase
VAFSRIAVIYNPHAGRPRERQGAVDRFASLLRERGREVEVCPTEQPLHATALAHQAVAGGCDLVVAHGGDGTMNEVLQALVGTPATLGFWPGGTANLLAAEIGFPERVDEVVERILAGRAIAATVGKANDRHFLLMAGIGLDAAVVAGVDPDLKRRLGKGAFGVAALQYIYRWDLAPFHVTLPDGERFEARFLVAGNAGTYGGGFRLTPEADLSDPCLDLCIFSAEARFDYLRVAAAAVVGAHRKLAGVTYRKVHRARVTSDVPIPVQLDGEVTGTLPLTLEAVPEAVRLLV